MPDSLCDPELHFYVVHSSEFRRNAKTDFIRITFFQARNYNHAWDCVKEIHSSKAATRMVFSQTQTFPTVKIKVAYKDFLKYLR